MWIKNKLLPKIWVFLSKFRRSPSPSKLERPHEVLPFYLFHGASNMCTKYFPNPSGAQPSSCPKEKKKEKRKKLHPNWASYVKAIDI